MHALEIRFSNRSDLASAIEAATGLQLIESATDEELLEAVRKRFRPQGVVVQVVPFDTAALEPEAA